MNRKRRRAASKGAQGIVTPATAAPMQADGSAGNIPGLFALAVKHHQAGRLSEAERLFRQVLAIDPRHADSLHLLGIIAFQAGRHDLAIDLFGKAIAINGREASYHSNLGNVLQARGRLDEAIACNRRALAIRPDFMEAHNNLGLALWAFGQLDEAVLCFRRALILQPKAAQVRYNLGIVLGERGSLDEAAACYRQTLTLMPGFVQAHNNLGNILRELGKPEEAKTQYERALSLKPDYAEAYNNLGTVLKDQGLLDEAVVRFERALFLKPDYNDAQLNLSSVYIAKGNFLKALDIAERALNIKDTNEAKALLVQCLRAVQCEPGSAGLESMIVRALSEPWDRPVELARCGANFVKLNEPVGRCIQRATAAYPSRLTARELFGTSDFAAVSQDRLLRVLLQSAPVCDRDLERFLTLVRFTLLEAADAAAGDNFEANALAFYVALAQQCFVNEYVFAVDENELGRASRLLDRLIEALAAGSPIPLLWLVAVAAYFPLDSLAVGEALLDRSWPDAMADLLTQQLREPREDRQYGAGIPRLTAIEDEVSLLVKQQYEENPYPRWVRSAPALTPVTIDTFMRSKFPFASFSNLGKGRDIDILIAGCGTGQHAIEIARRFVGARVLATDLSRASLSYARRKTAALSLNNIEYAEADILKLGSIGRMFDVVEAVGVLHHLSDPMQGWRVLLSTLRPGGFMHLGLYSALARQDIVAARAFITDQKYTRTADGIRRLRQDLLNLEDSRFDGITRSSDFFSTSSCRDLLFHVQEHRLTLPEIKAFLVANKLVFMGFEVGPQLLQAYRSQFSENRTLCDLDSWHVFETKNPKSFTGMYQFWIQKIG